MGIKYHELKLGQFFELSEIYDVPSYQRDYKWTEKEILQLLNDFWEFGQRIKTEASRDEIYYLGNIIRQGTKSGTDENLKFNFYLIDGQQRLTTIFLLKNYLLGRKKDLSGNSEQYNEDRNKSFYAWKNNTRTFKLINKNKTLENFIDKGEVENNNVYKNSATISKFLGEKINSLEDIEEWENIMNNTYIYAIEVGDELNAEFIFENINSKGKELTLSEKVKNKLFLSNNLNKKQSLIRGQGSKENESTIKLNKSIENKINDLFEKIEKIQEEIVDKKRIESPKVFSHINFDKQDELLRVLFTYLFETEIPAESPYDIIKTKIDDVKNLTELNDFVNSLIKAFEYLSFVEGLASKGLEESFYINWIISKSTALLPLTMLSIKKLIDNNVDFPIVKHTSKPEVLEEFRKLFKYISIQSIVYNGYNGINLWRYVPLILKDNKGDFDPYKNINFDNGDENSTTDEEFEKTTDIDLGQKLTNVDFYTRDKSLIKALLFLVERELEIEEAAPEVLTWSNMNENFLNKSWTIEHIIPKKIDSSTIYGREWISILDGEDHNSVLHKVGNLSLSSLSMNAKMKNNIFEKKVEHFGKSNLYINKELADYTKFDIDSVKVRGQKFKERILNILNKL